MTQAVTGFQFREEMGYFQGKCDAPCVVVKPEDALPADMRPIPDTDGEIGIGAVQQSATEIQKITSVPLK